jgi:hypothetical protein
MWVDVTSFTNNTAGAYGAGIENNNSYLDLTDTTFTTNTAQNAGALFVFYGDTQSSYSTFSGNSATDDRGDFLIENGEGWLDSTTFNTNVASNGGGIYSIDSKFNIQGCTFYRNSSSWQNGAGGGLDCHQGKVTAYNSTFYQNFACTGAGIHNSSASMSISDCTLTQNNAFKNGGGLYVSGSTLLNGDLVIGNTNGFYSGIDDIDGAALNKYSSDNLVGTDNTKSLGNNGLGNQVNVAVAMAGLGQFGYYNGGSTETIPLEQGSYALGKGLISGEQSASGNYSPDVDQNDAFRIDGWPGDIGAFQLSKPLWIVSQPPSTITYNLASPPTPESNDYCDRIGCLHGRCHQPSPHRSVGAQHGRWQDVHAVGTRQRSVRQQHSHRHIDDYRNGHHSGHERFRIPGHLHQSHRRSHHFFRGHAGCGRPTHNHGEPR